MLFIRVLAAAMVLAGVTAHALADNLVSNGGFETGNFDGWTTQPAASGTNFGVTGGIFQTGALSASFGAVGGQFDQIAQNLPTITGAAYLVSFWVNNNGGGGDSLQVAWNGVTVYNSTPVASPGIGWYQVNLVVFSSGPVSELRFSAYDGPSFVYIDNVVVDTNLVINPGFETGNFSGWTSLPAASGANFGVTGNGAFVHTGLSGAFFGATSNQFDQIAQTITTLPGRTYLLQFWAKNPGGFNGDALAVFWEGNLVYQAVPVGLLADQWTQHSFVVVSTSSSSELRIGGYDGPNFFGLDDFSLVQAINSTCNISGDANRDGAVNFSDITAVLFNYAATCTP